ncbi:MAG: DUF2461 family protein, partial [Bdellovibrionota bacterium]
LFASKEFARSFPGGFSDEKSATRPPRGFDPDHPKMKWLKLQAFFVWKPYSKKEFTSAKFPELLARDCRQIVRLNELLDKAISGRWVTSREPAEPKGLATRLGDIQAPAREMDF